MNWDWFYAMYSMAAIFMVVEFLWKIAIIPLAAVSLMFNEKVQSIYLFILTGVPYYLMASYAALVGLGIGEGERSVPVLIFGGLFLLLTGFMGVAQIQRRAQQDFDYETYRFASYKSYMVILALIYYIYAIFDTRPAINKLTIWVSDIMTWINDIPIVGILIAVVAFLYVLYVLFIMLLAVIGMIAMAFDRNVSQ